MVIQSQSVGEKEKSCWVLLRQGRPKLLRCECYVCITMVMADPLAPLYPVQLHSLLSRIMLKGKVIPVDKLSAGLMRKCVISQLFKSFFPPLGLCFFITAALQTTSLEGWLSFFWVIFWLAFRWQRERGGAGWEEVLTSPVIFMSRKEFWATEISGNLFHIHTVALVMMPCNQK